MGSSFWGRKVGKKNLGIAAGGMLVGLHKEKWVWRCWLRTVLWGLLWALGLIHTVVYVAEIQTQHLGMWLPKNWRKNSFWHGRYLIF